jgi:hypothetical protein
MHATTINIFKKILWNPEKKIFSRNRRVSSIFTQWALFPLVFKSELGLAEIEERGT